MLPNVHICWKATAVDTSWYIDHCFALVSGNSCWIGQLGLFCFGPSCMPLATPFRCLELTESVVCIPGDFCSAGSLTFMFWHISHTLCNLPAWACPHGFCNFSGCQNIHLLDMYLKLLGHSSFFFPGPQSRAKK